MPFVTGAAAVAAGYRDEASPGPTSTACAFPPCALKPFPVGICETMGYSGPGPGPGPGPGAGSVCGFGGATG